MKSDSFLKDQLRCKVEESGCSSLSTVRDNAVLVDTTNERNISKCSSKRQAEYNESSRPTKVKYK